MTQISYSAFTQTHKELGCSLFNSYSVLNHKSVNYVPQPLCGWLCHLSYQRGEVVLNSLLKFLKLLQFILTSSICSVSPQISIFKRLKVTIIVDSWTLVHKAAGYYNQGWIWMWKGKWWNLKLPRGQRNKVRWKWRQVRGDYHYKLAALLSKRHWHPLKT